MFLVLTFVACMMAFALFVGAWVNIPQKTITLPLFYIMPSVLFSGNPTQSYPKFYVYGVMLMATQIGMIMGFSMSMYEDFNGGFFDSGNVEKILAAKSIILCLAFLLVVENFSGIAALFFRTKIGLCQCMVFSERTRTFVRTWKFFGSALSLMTFYGMLKYKLAARRKY